MELKEIELNILINRIDDSQYKWFSESNKKFFGDLNYWFFEINNKYFLIRKTNAFTNMFDSIKKPHYRINHIEKTKDNKFKITDLIEDTFYTIEQAKGFLRTGVLND